MSGGGVILSNTYEISKKHLYVCIRKFLEVNKGERYVLIWVAE
jgi:hypothetical protein